METYIVSVHSCRNTLTSAETRGKKGSLGGKFYTRSKPSIYNICFVWYLHRIYLKTKVPLVAKGSRCVLCKLLPKSRLRKGEKWRGKFSSFSTEGLVSKYSKLTNMQ